MGRTFQGQSLSFSLVGVVIGGAPNGLASGVCLFLLYVSHRNVGFIDIHWKLREKTWLVLLYRGQDMPDELHVHREKYVM